MASKKRVGRPFEKGQSGNPGGRPKGLAARLKEKYGEDGDKLLDVLHEVAFAEEGVTPRDRVLAANSLLDRGWGKPIQRIEEARQFAPIFALPPGAHPSVHPDDRDE
jgi:hypothetical protein